MNRRQLAWIAPLLICLVALGMRLWYLDEARGEFDFEHPVVDAGYHDWWAWGVASGEWKLPLGAHVDPEFDKNPYFRPPLTAYWLAAIYAVAGHDPVAARLVQILLGCSGCLLLTFLGTRLFDRATGAAAGLLAATYWILVYFDLEYREVTLLAFLYPALAWTASRWLERPGAIPAALAGGLLGLAVLARPNSLLFLPAMLGWAWWATREGRPARSFRQLAVFLLATAALVLPVTIRNLAAGGDFVLVSSNGGINLYAGNNPRATGTAVSLPEDFPPFDSAFDYPAVARKVQDIEGRKMSGAEVSRWFARRALAHVAEQPGRAIVRTARKAAAFWSGREIVSEKNLVARRRASAALSAVPTNVSFVIVSAALGVVLFGLRHRTGAGSTVGDPRSAVLVLLLVGTYFVSLLPFFVTARFRAPIVPLLLLLSAFALRELARLAFARRFALLLPALAVAVGGYALHVRAAVHPVEESRDAANDLAARGAYRASEGRFDEAEALLRRAIAADPENGMARNNLGLLLGHLGRHAEAIEQLELAVRLDGADARPHQNLALSLLATGELQRALTEFGRAAELAPLDPAVAREAGLALLEADYPIFAVEHLERACRLAPNDTGAHYDLGIAYAQLRRMDEAVGAFERAAALAPDNPRVAEALERARQEAGGG